MRRCNRAVLVRMGFVGLVYCYFVSQVEHFLEGQWVILMVCVLTISLKFSFIFIIVAKIQTIMLTTQLVNLFKFPTLLPQTLHTSILQTSLTPFSSSKKIKDLQKQLKQKKKKSPQASNKKSEQIPEHLKNYNRIKKQTEDLQVASECQIENEIIIGEIKRQRVQLEAKDSVNNSQEQMHQELPVFKFGEKFLIGLSGTNVALATIFSMPIIGNNFYWLGMYSSCFLYPSLLFVTCAAIGTNLAYLIVRQGLALHTPTTSLKKIDITQAPLSFYLEMGLLTLQLYSLAISVSIPLTLLGLQPNIRNIGLYSILFFLLSANAHSTFQRKFFNNINYKISNPSTCFIVLFLLSSFIHVTYSLSEAKSKQDVKKAEQFQQGQNRVKNVWKTKKIVIENTKITDLLEQKQVPKEKAQTSNQQISPQNKKQTPKKPETSDPKQQQPQKTTKIW